MSFLLIAFSAAMLAGGVELVFRRWRRLPVSEGDSLEARERRLWAWTRRGLGIPVVIWVLVSLGLGNSLPPIHPRVEELKYSSQPWIGEALAQGGLGATVIASYWVAASLVGLLALLSRQIEDHREFRRELLIWGALTLPLAGLLLYFGGTWVMGGFATSVWLAGTTHGVLPLFAPTRRTPTYTLAIARMKFGKYAEAEKEVLAELDRCKTDFDGWMLLAELYAVHFREFDQAEQTIIELCDQPATTPSQASVALHRLADWHLELRQDPQAARRCLGAVSQRFPGTLLDRMAAQRCRQIPETPAELAEQRQPRTLHLPALHDELNDPAAKKDADLQSHRQRAEILAQRLARRPNDPEILDALARALFDAGQIRQALMHIETLLAMTDLSAPRKAEWLGLKATWIRRENPEDPRVRPLLSKIVTECPGTPQAVAARRQLHLMDEQDRITERHGPVQPKAPPRIVVRLDDPPVSGPSSTSS